MWLDFARVFSIIFVVLLHISAFFILEYEFGSFHWIVGNIVDSALRWTVPVFVMISGALLLDVKKSDTISVFYNKRFKRVALPMVFWSLFYSLWQFFRDSLAGRVIDYPELVLNFLTGQSYYHLWFLFMIFGIYAFAPFFKVLTSGLNKKDLQVLIGLSFFIAISYQIYAYINKNSELQPFLQFLLFTPYFFLGHYLKSYAPVVPSRLLVCMFTICWLLVSVGMYTASSFYGLDKGLYFYDYISVLVIPMSVSVFLLLKRVEPQNFLIKKFSSFSYLVLGVYLIHPFFLDLFLYKKIVITQLGVIPSIFIVFTAALFFSLLVSAFFNRFEFFKRFV